MTVTDLRRNSEWFFGATQRVLRVWLIVGAGALAIGVGLAALGPAFGLLPLPYRLALVDERLPVIFRLHMAASGLGVLLLPLVLAARRRPGLNRPLGIAAATAFVSNCTAQPWRAWPQSSAVPSCCD